MADRKTDVMDSILNILVKNLPPKDLIKAVATELNTAIPFDRFSISLSQLRVWYYYQDGQVSSQHCQVPHQTQASASRQVFENQTALLRRDILTENTFEYDHILSDEQIRSDLILPLTQDGLPIGTFNFSSKTPNLYTPEHLDTAQRLRTVLNLCIKTLKDQADREAQEQITQALQNHADANTIIKLIMSHLQSEYDRIRLYLYDTKTNTMQGRYQAIGSELLDHSDRTYPLDQDPYTQRTLSSDMPQIYQAHTAEHRRVVAMLGQKPNFESLDNKEWAEIPLKIQSGGQDQIIGKISLDNALSGVPLYQDTLNQHVVFIRQAAIALRQTELYHNMSQLVEQNTQQLSSTNHQLEQKDKLLSALHEVSHNSFSYLNQDDILDNFAKRIIYAGICRSLMIALVDHETETVEVVRAFQRESPSDPSGNIRIVNYEETIGTRYHINDDNITPMTARTGEMQIAETISDKRLDKRYETKTIWADKVAYFIPVKREGKTVAVLATGSTGKEKGAFLDRFKTMAPLFDQLGIALEHAALYQSAHTNEAHYRSLFENMHDAFAYRKLRFDDQNLPTDYTFLDVNQTYADLFGRSQSEIVGKTLSDIYPEGTEVFKEEISKYIEVATTGESQHFETYLPTANKWFAVSAYSPQKNHFATIATNVTERKLAERRMAELLDFQNNMLDTPLVWICAFDEKRKMTFWNRGAELISGYASDAVVGSAEVWEKLYPDTDYFKKYLESATETLDRTGKIEHIESTICCKDGSQKTISWYANRLTGTREYPEGFLAIGLDITDRKQMETEIVRLERLKALGELAAGVSHNLNNMLTGILLPAAMLKDTDLPDAAKENVEDIFVSANRARDLVAQLNQSVRKDNADLLEPVDVNQAITEAVRATRARWKDESESNGIQIQMVMNLHNTTSAKATSAGLHDVLINLIFNAVDALPKGGDITLASKMKDASVQITISDNGIGMSPDIQMKVFEPFFTTKMDVGTGLGLSTAYSQVDRWQGELTVSSELGKGTTFTIELPLWLEDAPVTEKPTESTQPHCHILIVEDDPQVRRVLERFLSPFHTLKIANNGQKAIQLLETESFDLAILDLGLPDMPGDEVANKIKQRQPTLPTILITGWALTEEDARKAPFEEYIQKPLANPHELLDTIARLTKKNVG